MRRPSLTGGEHTLLKTLNSFTPRYNLCVRVTDRSPVTEFTNKRTSSPGYIFNATLLDTEGVCMNCKFWNGAAQKFDPIVQKNVILKMANPGKIVAANRRFSNIEHNYEISVDNTEADITVAGEEAGEAEFANIPKAPSLSTCKFVNLRTVAVSNTRLPYFSSVCALIHDIQPVRSVQLKRTGNAESTTVRNVLLVDPTKHSIELSLWGNTCEQFPYEVGDVIFLQNVQLKAKNPLNATPATPATAIQVATIRSTEIYVNPPSHTNTEQYAQWYAEEGKFATYKPLSDSADSAPTNSRTLVETDLKGMYKHLEVNDSETFFKIPAAFITNVAYQRNDDPTQFNIVYQACVSCNKKFNDQGQCPTCHGDSSLPKISTNITLTDHSASEVRVRCFTDQAQLILSRQPRQIKDLIDTNDLAHIKDLLDFSCLWKKHSYIIRARKEEYNNSTRVSLVVANVVPINHNAHVAQTMKAISQLLPDAFDYQAAEQVPASPQVEGDLKRVKVDP